MRIAMGMVDELVLEPLGPLDAFKPRIEFLRLTYSRGESTVIKHVSDSVSRRMDSTNDRHYRTRSQQDDLLPDSPTFIFTDCVNLVKYDPLFYFLVVQSDQGTT